MHALYKYGVTCGPLPSSCTHSLTHQPTGGPQEGRAGAEVSEPFMDNFHNYRAVNDGEGMSVSDHSPVYATFTLSTAPVIVGKRMALKRMSSQGSRRSSSFERSNSAQHGSGSSGPNSIRSLSVDPIWDILSETKARIEISDITVLSLGEFGEQGEGHGAEMEPPRQVDVVFPAPFEVDNGGEGVLWTQSQGSAGWEAEKTRSATCRRLRYKADGSRVDFDTVPTLALEFDGARTVDAVGAKRLEPVVGNLHVLLRVMIPTTVGATRVSATSAQAEKETLVAGQCVLSLAQLREVDALGASGSLTRAFDVVLEDGGTPLVLEDHGQVTVQVTIRVAAIGS